MHNVKPSILAKEILVFEKGKLKNLTDRNLLIVFHGDAEDLTAYYTNIDKLVKRFHYKILAYKVNIGKYYWAIKKAFPYDVIYDREKVKLVERNVSYVPTHLFVGHDGSSAYYIGKMKDNEIELALTDLYVNNKPTLIQTITEYNMEEF